MDFVKWLWVTGLQPTLQGKADYANSLDSTARSLRPETGIGDPVRGGTFSATAAERIPPPQDLYDGGDYYTLRDRSLVSLWRSAREIAVQRSKALPPETVSRSANAERLVASMEACGTPTTHQLEILSVSDAS